VLPPKSGPKEEPTDSSLIASLVQPDRSACVSDVAFSPDGARLFTSGTPSGLVQIWDVASRKEVRQIETPRGYPAAWDYARLTPDWKTLYVPTSKNSTKRIERDGKRLDLIENTGAIGSKVRLAGPGRPLPGVY
jgi:WD40 repeat protein